MGTAFQQLMKHVSINHYERNGRNHQIRINQGIPSLSQYNEECFFARKEPSANSIRAVVKKLRQRMNVPLKYIIENEPHFKVTKVVGF